MQTAITVSRQPETVLQAVEILRARGVLEEKRARGIINCQADKKVQLVCATCGNVAEITLQGCGSRLCPHCNRKRRQKVYHHLQGVFSEFETLRFLTLGFKNVAEITPSYFDECQEQFRLFKQNLARVMHGEGCLCGRCDYGRKAVKGYTLGSYVNVMELKFHRKGEPIRSRKDGSVIGEYTYDQWNVHYHVLYDGDFIPQGIAQDLFSRATGGESFYTYIKACAYQEPVRYQRAALVYVLKYLSKVEGHGGDPRIIAEFYEATKKSRFYNVGLKKKDRSLLPKKQKLTCNVCDGQQWYSSFTVPSEQFGALVNSAVSREGAYFAPPKVLSLPSVENVGEELQVSFDDSLCVVSELSDSPKSRILTYLRSHGISKYNDLLVGTSLSEKQLDEYLNQLSYAGEILSIRPGEWLALQ